MGENLKISIFFGPPKISNFFRVPPRNFNCSGLQFKSFKKCQDTAVLFDKMYRICLKSLIDCM